jgi:membrane protease YdiL (CAAX protease family)
MIGLLFGLIRWRAGGVAGLILVHGLDDFLGVELQYPVTISSIDQILTLSVVHPEAAYLGDALLLALFLYLWKLHPWLERRH